MTHTSATLSKPLIQEMTSHSSHYGGKALTFLSFAIGLGLTVLLALLPWANISEGQHSALSMATIMPQHHTAFGKNAFSIMPQHQTTFGKKAFSWQSRPAPPFQPSLSQQKFRQVSAEAWNPRPYQVTSEKFQEKMSSTSEKFRFLDPLSQAFINDYLNDLHFYVFNQNYKYDGLFALGLRELFVAGIGAYEKLAGTGEGELLWDSLCGAVELDPKKVAADAETMKSYAKSTSSADILKAMDGTGEKPSDSLVAEAFEEYKKHSQFRSIGLFKVMEFSGIKPDKDKAQEWAKAAKIKKGLMMKDLQNFRTNLRKMQDGEEMLKDMTKRREKAEKEKKDE